MFMSEEAIDVSANEVCSCIEDAEKLMGTSTDQPFNTEERALAESWCKSCIAPAFIAEYLRGGNQYFAAALVSTKLGRKLEELERVWVSDWCADGWSVEAMVEELQSEVDTNPDIPAG